MLRGSLRGRGRRAGRLPPRLRRPALRRARIAVRPWLYRVAHNRCIDYVRRAPATPLQPDELLPGGTDPVVEAERREDLRRLVADLHALPEQQRSALIIRELEGLSYDDLATTLGVTVPAVKSLLVRARSGLAEAAEARDDRLRADPRGARARRRPPRPPAAAAARPPARVRRLPRPPPGAAPRPRPARQPPARGPSSLLLGGWLATLLGSGGGGASSAADRLRAGRRRHQGARGRVGLRRRGRRRRVEVADHREHAPARPRRARRRSSPRRRRRRAPPVAPATPPPAAADAAPGPSTSSTPRPGPVDRARRPPVEDDDDEEATPTADADPDADRRRRPPSRRPRRRRRPRPRRRAEPTTEPTADATAEMAVDARTRPLSSALRERGARLRLDRHRLRLRRQRQRAAAGREGLPRRACSRRAAATRDEDFAKTTWNARRYYWLPRLGLQGHPPDDAVQGRLRRLRLRRRRRQPRLREHALPPAPGSAFYRDPQWARARGLGVARSRPHYETAERMLGVTDVRGRGPGRPLLRELADEMGVADTYSTTRVGVFFGEPGETVADPYFGGEGPPRAGCIRCGALHGRLPPQRQEHAASRTTSGSPSGAASQILPERTVADVRPLGARRRLRRLRGHERALRRLVRKDAPTLTARGVVVAAGALGTNQLLQRCRLGGSLPRLSDRIGHLVRTNSEAISAVTTRTTATTSPSRSRSPRASIPTPTRTSRTSPTARGGGLDGAALHAPDARGHARTRPLSSRGAAPPAPLLRALAARGRGARSSCSPCRRSTTRCGCARKRNLLGLGPAPADARRIRTSPTRASSPVADQVTRRARREARRARRRRASPRRCSTSRRPRTSWAAR